MAGAPDPADAERSDDPPLQLQGHGRQVLQTTGGVLAEEVRRCPREHAPRLDAQEMADVRERINPLDGQLAVTAPVGRHLFRLVGVDQHAGVLGEVEVHVDGRRFADGAGREQAAGVLDGRKRVAVPQRIPHAGALDGRDDPVALRDARRHRLVLDDVEAGGGSSHAEIGGPLDLRGDASHLRSELSDGPRDVAAVGDAEAAGHALVAAVLLSGAVVIVSHGDHLEPRVDRQRLRDDPMPTTAEDHHPPPIRCTHRCQLLSSRPRYQRTATWVGSARGLPRPRPRAGRCRQSSASCDGRRRARRLGTAAAGRCARPPRTRWPAAKSRLCIAGRARPIRTARPADRARSL